MREESTNTSMKLMIDTEEMRRLGAAEAAMERVRKIRDDMAAARSRTRAAWIMAVGFAALGASAVSAIIYFVG